MPRCDRIPHTTYITLILFTRKTGRINMEDAEINYYLVLNIIFIEVRGATRNAAGT
jgi:hypothetical protein